MGVDVTQHEKISVVSAHFVSAASLRRRTDWFIKLRWGAVLGVWLFSLGAALLGNLPLPLEQLLGLGALLLLFNIGCKIFNGRTEAIDIAAELNMVKVQMVVDLVLLTAVLHYSGGVENPFQFIAIIHVIIASLLLKGRQIFQIAWIAGGLFTAMVLGEQFGLLHHYHLLSASDLTHEWPYVLMAIVSLWMVLLISAWIGSRIMQHNRAIKDELVLRQQDLVAADRAQLDFFRFVTHEVKSPIVTAQSAVEAAREIGGADLSPTVRDMLGRAVRRLNLALTIVKDLADLTRGSMAGGPSLRSTDLKAVVAGVLEQQAEAMATQRLTLKTDLPDDPVHLRSDEGMLDKIVVNLVNNAVRYSHDGGTVQVALVVRNGQVVLTVRDEGIGITPEDQLRVFEEFFRATAAREMSDLGTGLGLPIVKRFTEQLGGSIELASRLGEGTIVTVTLPQAGPLRPSETEDQG